MEKRNRQYGFPYGDYQNTKAIIESLTGLVGGETAYATDYPEAPFGKFGTGSWHWSNNEIGGGGGAVDSVNGYIGVVVLDPDDLDDTATTNKFTTAAEITKLAGIETAADVTDIANVGAALNGASADTPLDADTFHFWDAVDAIMKDITWANVKTTLKTYFDTLYAVLLASTASNDFQVGNGSGGWIKKTLAETITILRTAGVTMDIFYPSGQNAQVPGSSTNYLNPYGLGLFVSAGRAMVLTRPGILKNLTTVLNAAQPAGGNLVCTVVDGAGTSLGITTTYTPGQSGVKQDTTNTYTITQAMITAGIAITIKLANASGSASGNIGGFGLEMEYT